jgi:hypothetical protein
MPSKTPKQRRAMRAAAAGHSTLGIPQSIGQEFVAADKRAAKKKAKSKKTNAKHRATRKKSTRAR